MNRLTVTDGNDQFYPTPKAIISKMLAGIDFELVSSVLEPSAGKGDICAAVAQRIRSDQWRRRSSDMKDPCADIIETIEIDENLRHILKGKEYRVVHDDFLTYQSRKRYDLIVMNPPFAEGDKHLTKALDLQEYGGMIRCLLNAETIRNPYSNIRKALVRRLDKLDAKIEFIPGAFETAERTARVEVALVRVDIAHNTRDSLILDELEKAREAVDDDNEPTALAHGDFIRAIVDQYRFEVDVGVKLIREYAAVYPYIQDSLREKETCKNPILELKLYGNKYNSGDVLNGYIRACRLKYWDALFRNPAFTSRLTSNLCADLCDRVNDLADYEFSYRNILDIQLQMSQQTIKGIEDTIVALFDQMSGKHAYHEELDNSNIHYFDGWKTNKAWKINKKVILQLYGALEVWCGELRFGYGFKRKIHDIITCLDFLSADFKYAGNTENRLENAIKQGQTRDISLGHISITTYKKGTCHITFEDERLLDKFNLFGAQRKNWLPPSYGKKWYVEMTTEEKTVIDSYQGAAEYAKVMENPGDYIIETAGMLALGDGSEGGVGT